MSSRSPIRLGTRVGLRTRVRIGARVCLGALVALVGAVLVPAATLAHPLGNFTINHHSEVRVAATAVVVDHVLDLAEIPTFAALRAVDADGDGLASDPERVAAATSRCAEQAAGVSLIVAGTPVPLAVGASAVSFPAGQGAPTMRLVCRLEAAVAGGIAGGVSFADPTFPERAGWREIVVLGDGVTVSGPVATASLSARLTRYPEGLLAQAPSVSAVSFSVAAGGPALPPLVQPELGVGAGATIETPAAVPGGSAELTEDLAALFQADELTWPIVLLSLLAAAGLGALHALSPGHGKTVMAAYLVGSRGTARQALGLGTTVTVSHTLGVLALGAVSLSASAIIPPERLYPLLGVVSGAVVMGIAAWLLLGIGRGWWTRRAARLTHVHAHASGAAHDHGATHAHGGAHAHPSGAAHDHGAPHAHPSGAAHDHGAHAHPSGATHDHGHSHADSHQRPPAGEADGWHSHGGIRHTHQLPGGQPFRWRALFALGLAGGMVPSVSAIILLLGSIAAGRPAYGIALTVAFGVGMAAVLVGIGLGLVYARGLLDRLPRQSPGRALARFVPAGSAAVMLVAGVVITAQALTTLP